MNQLVLVGRLVKDVEVEKLEDGRRVANITLAIQRPFKNQEGVYECDFINCIAFDHISDSIKSYCEKGDLIAVKGRLQSRPYKIDETRTEHRIEVIAERISFLSKKKSVEEN